VHTHPTGTVITTLAWADELQDTHMPRTIPRFEARSQTHPTLDPRMGGSESPDQGPPPVNVRATPSDNTQ
jgi:hypothetical protein